MSGLIRSLNKLQEPLNLALGDSVLVLFDPEGSVCSEIRDQGLIPVCVPDRQSGITPELTHETIFAESIPQLLESDRSFKLAVATEGLERFVSVTKQEDQLNLLHWLRKNSEVSLFTAPRSFPWLLANQLGPYQLNDLCHHFKYLTEVDSSDLLPFIALSDNYLGDGKHWYTDFELSAIDANLLGQGNDLSENNGLNPRVRTFKTTDNNVIKFEVTSPDYFERSQVQGEANFLPSIPDAVSKELNIPKLKSQIQGRAVVTLAREYLCGDTTMGPNLTSPSEIAISLISLASNFAKHGYFHNDIRPWNVIWLENKPSFIDFADTSMQDLDVQGIPNLAALFGTTLYFSGLIPQGYALENTTQFVDQLTSILTELGLTSLNDEYGFYSRSWLKLPFLNLTDQAFLSGSLTYRSLWDLLTGNSDD